MEELVHDGLRLSQGLARKTALAGLWWGGAQGRCSVCPSFFCSWSFSLTNGGNVLNESAPLGIIARLPDYSEGSPRFRETLFKEYGSFMTSLQGYPFFFGFFCGAGDLSCKYH